MSFRDKVRASSRDKRRRPVSAAQDRELRRLRHSLRHDGSIMTGNERAEPPNGIVIAAFLPNGHGHGPDLWTRSMDPAGAPALVPVFISTPEIL
jgi:hypothetical protein